MFYKIMKDGKVIDVCCGLRYVKYQPKNKIMLKCSVWEAEGIVSSNGEEIWHEITMPPFPVDGYDTVEAQAIDEHEYKQLKALGGKTPEEIIDAYTLFLIEEGLL